MTRNDVKEFVADLLIEESREWKDSVDGCSWKIEKEGDYFHFYKTGINAGKIKSRYIACFYDEKSFLDALRKAWSGNIATKKEWIEAAVDDDDEIAYLKENLTGDGDDLYMLSCDNGEYYDIERLVD